MLFEYIQGDSGVVDVTADVLLGHCDKKNSSYKQVYDFEHLQNYDRL